MVHPVPTPLPAIAPVRRRRRAGGRSQKLMLLSRAKAISGAATIRGSSQFPNPPMKVGITKKKIIRRAWAVTMELYSCPSWNKDPGCISSVRIRILMEVPMRPAQIPRIK